MEPIRKKSKENKVEKVARRPHLAYKSVKNGPKMVQDKGKIALENNADLHKIA